jgi:hypothetical protein
MKAILSLILVSILSLSAFARAWRPFVGVGGVAEIPIRGYDLLGHAGDNHDAYAARKGTQFEFGVRSRGHEFYAAYHFTNSRVSESRSVQDTEIEDSLSHYILLQDIRQDSYRERLFILGYRYEPAARPHDVVRPIMGGGLGIDVTTYRFARQNLETDYTYHTGDWLADTLHVSSSEGTRRSQPLPGILLEFGLALSVWRPIDLLVMSGLYAHAERYEINSGYFEASYSTYYLLTPSLSAKVRYVFGKSPTVGDRQ